MAFSAGITATRGSSGPGIAVAEGSTGTGIGVIGTSDTGPAFVPITVSDLTSFINKFGVVTPRHFGTLAAGAWLESSKEATYVRLLGIGDGKRNLLAEALNIDGENVPAGGVKNAGFVVGSRLTGSNGRLQSNSYAVDEGLPGRTYFLGSFMSESAGSRYLSDAGIQVVGENVASPILRGVIFAASGVLPALSGCYTENASTASLGATVGSFDDKQDGGASVGSINTAAGADTFVLLLNGHVGTTEYPNTITASLNRTATDDIGRNIFISSSLNTDPTKLQEAGHYLYTYYTVEASQAVVTGSGIVTAASPKSTPSGQFLEDSIFLVTSSIARNVNDSAGDLAIPNFENWNNRYQTAFSPTVISQRFDGKQYDLFTLHAINDGAAAARRLKVTIENIIPQQNEDEYGQFDIVIRDLSNPDNESAPLGGTEKYTGVNLDPASDSYIGKIIGDKHKYYNFNTDTYRQKLIDDGVYPNASGFVRVKVSDAVANKTLPNKILPAGFRGFHHLVTSGSSIMSNPQHPLADGSVIDAATEWAQNLVEPPIPYRVKIGNDTSEAGVTQNVHELNANLCWGVQTSQFGTVKYPNRSTELNTGIYAYQSYFPDFTSSRQRAWVGDNSGVADSAGTVYDSDRYNNNKFSLENILVHTQSDSDVVNNQEWAYAQYRRDRKKIGLYDSTLTGLKAGVRFYNFDKDLSKTQPNTFAKFTFMLQGGFDGTNIFSKEKNNFTNLAARYETLDENQGLQNGPTVLAYNSALKVLSEKADVDFKLLALPGIRVEQVTNKALAMAEERFDTFYVMDIEEVTAAGAVVTGSQDVPDPSETAARFRSRVFASSFGAVYFPDIEMSDPSGESTATFFTPPSISAVRVFSRLDAAGNVFAPAGQQRGVISPNDQSKAIQAKVKFDQTQKETIKTLYDVGINPIIAGDGSPLMLYGQRTLLTEVSSLMQRISIRRMVIDIRRGVKNVAKGFLFEKGKEETLKEFEQAASGVVSQMVNVGGVSTYDVTIDMSTTTQADIEANIVRGHVILQPTRSDEMIQVDFST